MVGGLIPKRFSEPDSNAIFILLLLPEKSDTHHFVPLTEIAVRDMSAGILHSQGKVWCSFDFSELSLRESVLKFEIKTVSSRAI